MIENLIAAIAQSDTDTSRRTLQKLLQTKQNPWKIHEALFAVAQTVLNPPFINPHLAKMYAIDREFVPYLNTEDTALLLDVEVEEFARREKLPPLEKPTSPPSGTTFSDIEKAIGQSNVAETAIRMESFLQSAGSAQFAGKMLLLGSNYLNNSLGHSVSCTAFILLEMIQRKDQNPWPVLSLLADYFCKGSFQHTPDLQSSSLSAYTEAYLYELQRAVSGTGIVALHHPITLYAIERSRHFFSPGEYDHMLTMWSKMMRQKKEKLLPIEKLDAENPVDFKQFFNVFSGHNPKPLLNMIGTSLGSKNDRRRIGNYLIKSVLQSYNGEYNPHSLTGLGSALWMMENFSDQQAIVINGVFQYLDYFFGDIS